MADKSPRHLWLDLETTGLHPTACEVLEVAAVVTNADLEEIDSFETVVSHDIESLQMARWPWKQHTENGLLDDIAVMREKHPTYGTDYVDKKLEGFIREYSVIQPLRLCGSSVHFDREFMRYHLPASFEALYYRQFDVSGFYEIAPWMNVEFPETNKAHRAMDDVRRSLEIARHFKELLSQRA